MIEDKITEKILEYFQSGEVFVLEQIPDILQQTLKYKELSNTISLIVSFVLFLILVPTCIIIYKYAKRDNFGDIFPLCSAIMWISILFSFVSVGVFIESVFELIKINTSPKFYLLELFLKLNGK